LPAPPPGTEPAFIGTITAGPAPYNITAYRYYGGGPLSPLYGSFVTTDVYTNPNEAISRLSLPPGNTAQCVSTVTIPKGTQIQSGTVGEAFSQLGGGSQIQLLERIPATAFEQGVPIETFSPNIQGAPTLGPVPNIVEGGGGGGLSHTGILPPEIPID
jgi:hypothetical protein